MPSVYCVLCITVEPPDAQRLSAIITKFNKQSVNVAIKTTLMYPGGEPIRVLAHVTLKELDYGMKTSGSQSLSL